MRYRNWVIALFIAAALAGGFKAGYQYELRARQAEEVKADCAYYDMDSGEFKWGPKPITLGVLPPDLPPALQDAAHQLQEGLRKAFGNNGQ